MAPGASFGSGMNHSTIELKGAISSLVATTIPGTVLVREGAVLPLNGHHLTIHANLMVHLRCEDSTIELAPSGTCDGALIADIIHLATLAAAPPEATQAHLGRTQSTWDGGSAIIPLAPDDNYDPVTTYLLLDIWATRSAFSSPGHLPGPGSGARVAVSNNGSTVLGPIPAEWGFRIGPRPDCVFYFRCWYADILELGGAPFITVRSKRTFSTAELLTFTPKPLQYEIRGWGASVTLVVGQFTFRLTLDEARALADSVEKANPIEVQGAIMVPIIIANEKFGFHLASEEAAKVPGYLRSAIRSASGES